MDGWMEKQQEQGGTAAPELVAHVQPWYTAWFVQGPAWGSLVNGHSQAAALAAGQDRDRSCLAGPSGDRACCESWVITAGSAQLP